jgi:hypothetical protein
MINRRPKPAIKLNAAQKELYDRLTIPQRLRLIAILEMKQKLGYRRVIKASGNPKRARPNQATQDTQGIENQYSDRLM